MKRQERTNRAREWVWETLKQEGPLSARALGRRIRDAGLYQSDAWDNDKAATNYVRARAKELLRQGRLAEARNPHIQGGIRYHVTDE